MSDSSEMGEASSNAFFVYTRFIDVCGDMATWYGSLNVIEYMNELGETCLM